MYPQARHALDFLGDYGESRCHFVVEVTFLSLVIIKSQTNGGAAKKASMREALDNCVVNLGNAGKPPFFLSTVISSGCIPLLNAHSLHLRSFELIHTSMCKKFKAKREGYHHFRGTSQFTHPFRCFSEIALDSPAERWGLLVHMSQRVRRAVHILCSHARAGLPCI